MTYLAKEHGQSLTQYDMVKLHVMTDVYHVIEHGTPVIGGTLDPWDHGPVVKRAYDYLMGLWRRYRETGLSHPVFSAESSDTKKVYFSPKTPIDYDDLSESEIAAMDRAWNAVMSLDWTASQKFFHEPSSFMGRAWKNAESEQRPIDWIEIIDAYDEETGNDHQHIKRIIRL